MELLEVMSPPKTGAGRGLSGREPFLAAFFEGAAGTGPWLLFSHTLLHHAFEPGLIFVFPYYSAGGKGIRRRPIMKPSSINCVAPVREPQGGKL